MVNLVKIFKVHDLLDSNKEANSAASTSDLVKNHEHMFPRNYMHNHVCNRFYNSTTMCYPTSL